MELEKNGRPGKKLLLEAGKQGTWVCTVNQLEKLVPDMP